MKRSPMRRESKKHETARLAKRKPARQVASPAPPEQEVVSTWADFERVASRVVSDGPRKVGPAIEKPARLRSRRYLSDVRGQPCEKCGGAAVDAHHTKIRGRRDDTFDLTAIPLCRQHHDDAHAGRIATDDLHRMLGAYLCRRLPQLVPTNLAAMLREMINGLGATSAEETS